MLNKWAHRGDFRSVDTLLGEAGNDLLVGSSAMDALYASLGTDSLFGGGGRRRAIQSALQSELLRVSASRLKELW
jgi:Ca2+-binding RTX toxin-like protein